MDTVISLFQRVSERLAESRDEPHYPQGTEIVFNHMTMNCRPEVWGEDSMKFRPERWINPGPAIKDDTMPGWEGVANFGSGNRQCVGAGFAVMVRRVLFITWIPISGMPLCVMNSDVRDQ